MSDAKLHDIGFDEYQKLPNLNFSTAKHIKKCPRVMRTIQTCDSTPTPAMELGTAVHTAILEPRRFKKEYKQAPEGVRRGSKAWQEIREKYPKASILRHTEYLEVTRMRDSLATNTEAMGLLDGGYTEASMTWTDSYTGLDLKCRIDKCIMTEDDAIIIDIKTTTDASPRAMGNRMVTSPYHYLLQMAWYQRGFEEVFTVKPRAIIIAIEKTMGYPTAMYDINPVDLDMAGAEVSELLDMITKSYESGGEGHYERRFLDLPKWYYTTDTEEESTI